MMIRWWREVDGVMKKEDDDRVVEGVVGWWRGRMMIGW